MVVSNPGPAGWVVVWGSVDLPGLGDQVLARVAEAELAARLPGWRLRLSAPLGLSRPTVTDGGVVAQPSALGVVADVVVAAPAFALDEDLGELYDMAETVQWPRSVGPTVLSGVRLTRVLDGPVRERARTAAIVTVRDADSVRILRESGVDGAVEIVPHPGVELSRIVDLTTLSERIRQLRMLGYLPDGAYSVLAAAHEPDATVVESMRASVPAPLLVLPVGRAPLVDGLSHDLVLEDRLAVLAGAEFVLAADEHSAAASAALGAPWLLWDPAGTERSVVIEFAGGERVVDSLQDLPAALASVGSLPRDVANTVRLAAHYDAVARLVRDVLPQPSEAASVVAEAPALRAANARLRQRMLVERGHLVDALAETRTERDHALAEVDAVRADVAGAREAHRHAMAQLQRIQQDSGALRVRLASQRHRQEALQASNGRLQTRLTETRAARDRARADLQRFHRSVPGRLLAALQGVRRRLRL